MSRELDVADMIDWFAQQQVTFVPGVLGFNGTETPRKQVTLSPGEEATVLWSLDMACRPGMSESSSMSIDTLRFKVRWLGVGTTRELSLERPTSHSRPPCRLRRVKLTTRGESSFSGC